jgi:glycosyltransferase involved in cell wall biosynthesis
MSSVSTVVKAAPETVSNSLKVWLIQDIVAPYRIKLFDTVSRTPGIDFRLILLAKKSRFKPQWKITADSLPFPAEQIPGVNFYLGYARRYSFNPRLFIRMMQERPDVVICAGYSFATMLAFIYKLLTGNSYVIWMEGTHVTEKTRLGHATRRLQRTPLTRCAGALVDAGTESHRYIESLLGSGRRPPFFTSYNAVDNENIADKARRFRADQASFASFKAKYAMKNIIFVGQLIERKGISQLIDAYRVMLSRSNELIGLMMLGDGPLRGYLEDVRAKEKLSNLFLEGFIEQDEYPKFLAVADVMVLPSLSDPNPLVVFEAMAAGNPIVVSERAGNAADFVEEGVNGYVIDPLNVDALATKLLSVLNRSPEDIDAMGKRSLQLVKKANYEDSAKAFVDAAKRAAGVTGGRV